jgi:hypothetical protein
MQVVRLFHIRIKKYKPLSNISRSEKWGKKIQAASSTGARMVYQRVSCEGAIACVCVHAKSILKSVCDVHACGSFSGMQCAIALLHTFWNKTARKYFFVLKTILERTILF